MHCISYQPLISNQSYFTFIITIVEIVMQDTISFSHSESFFSVISSSQIWPRELKEIPYWRKSRKFSRKMLESTRHACQTFWRLKEISKVSDWLHKQLFWFFPSCSSLKYPFFKFFFAWFFYLLWRKNGSKFMWKYFVLDYIS